MDKPKEYKSVLAKISHVNDLGVSQWYEVIYFDEVIESWKSYAGSKTFEDGEQVIKWKYADECL